MTNHKEFESWCKTTGHDYCFDLNQSGKYQWADAQGAYEAFCYGLPQPAQKPLTDEQLKPHYQNQEWLDGVRFAEAAHGIKSGTDVKENT